MSEKKRRGEMKMIVQPKELKATLFPHQLAIVYKMEELERINTIRINDSIINTRIGINGDIAGYGKTLSMVALTLRNKMEWDMTKPYVSRKIETFCRGNLTNIDHTFHERINATLVICDRSLANQWNIEFSKTPLRTILISCKDKAKEINMDNYDVAIVVSSMYNHFIERFFNVYWKRVIYDSPDHFRIKSMIEFKFGFLWLVTSTPHRILTTYANLRNNFIAKLFQDQIHVTKFVDAMTIKNPKKFVLESFVMPEVYHRFYYCYSKPKRFNLNSEIDRILDFIDKNEIEKIIKEIGGRKIDDFSSFFPRKKRMELAKIREKIRNETDEKKIDEGRDEEKKILSYVIDFRNELNERLKSECKICLSPIEVPVLEPRCNNIFCSRCLFTWLKQKDKCPLCRSFINIKSLCYITSEEKKENRLPTKEQTILSIIFSHPKGKFIIFYSDNSLKIPSILQDCNIPYLQISGGMRTIQNNISKFNKGVVSILLLTQKNKGSGLNLQAATDIIICNETNNSSSSYITERAVRIGRIEPLTVHHLHSQE